MLLYFNLFVSFALAQTQIPTNSTPPAACSAECLSFDLTSCKQTFEPISDQDWDNATKELSECLCPKVSASTSCGVCLIEKAPAASTYFQSLKTACNVGNEQEFIAKLFNHPIKSLEIPATGPASLPPQSTEKSGTHNLGSSTAAACVVLFVSSMLL